METVIFIPSSDLIKAQLREFQEVYPNIHLKKDSETELRLGGRFTLRKEFGGYQSYEDYTIDIIIPIGSSQLPYVIDVDKRIDPNYHHYYRSGKLCLETDVKIFADFTDGFDLLRWMDIYVESYFFTYEYYMRYGEFPYGERSHGLDGVLESYQDLLGTKDLQETYDMMHFILNNRYRGHRSCPCKSGKKTRNCHGKKMIPFYKNRSLNKIMQSDYAKIKEALIRRDANKEKTK